MQISDKLQQFIIIYVSI